jgi:DNA-binding transcriptional MerR regulator
MSETPNTEQDTEKAGTPAGMLPIRTVASLTGVNPVTLRAWERRYNLVTPHRTPKGHRLYTRENVEFIKQVLELLDQGISISQVKPLLGQMPADIPDAAVAGQGDSWRSYQQTMLKAIDVFDESALDSAYNDALSLYPVDTVSQRLITPILRMLGEHWKDTDAGIAQEHFFSVYLRNKLGTRIHHMNQRSNGPLLLLACLPGEFHETGLLLFSLASMDLGYRVLLLGANTPLNQLPAVLEKKSCAGIVLSCTFKPSPKVLEKDLPELVNKVKTPVFIGGSFASRYREKFEVAGAVCLGETIGSGLKLVSQHCPLNHDAGIT